MNLKIDSCSLILMQHLDIIELINSSIGKLIITEAVYKETIEQGLKKHKAVAEHLLSHYKNNTILKIQNQGLIPPNLDLGEAETIAETLYEKNRNERVVCITEDKKAKRVAISNHIDVLGVDSLLVELCIKGGLSEDEFDEKIELLDNYHKLDLIRITELRRFIKILKKKEGD